MALVSNTTDVTPTGGSTWKIPPGQAINESFIPRGMVTFDGTTAVAALGAGDSLRVRVRFQFPTNYVYLLKDFSFYFASDDQSHSMESQGQCIFEMTRGLVAVNMFAPLSYEYTTLQSDMLIYQLVEPYKIPLLDGPAGDQMIVALADITPTSVAGDIQWGMSFYQYDIEQALHYPIHTQMPVQT